MAVVLRVWRFLVVFIPSASLVAYYAAPYACHGAQVSDGVRTGVAPPSTPGAGMAKPSPIPWRVALVVPTPSPIMAASPRCHEIERPPDIARRVYCCYFASQTRSICL